MALAFEVDSREFLLLRCTDSLLLDLSTGGAMLKRNWRALFVLIALSIDAIAIALAGVSAYFLRKILPSIPQFDPTLFVQVTSFIATIVLFSALVLGLYRASYRTSLKQQYSIAWRTFLVSIPVTLSLFYLLQWSDFPRRFAILFFSFLPIFFVIGRFWLNRFNLAMQQSGYGVRNAIIYGYEKGWEQVLERFEGLPELGYALKGIVVKDAPVSTREHYQVNGYKIPVYSKAQLPSLLEQDKIDRIFIPSTNIVSNGSAAILDHCRQKGIKLKVLSPEADRLLQFVHVHDIAGITLYAPARLRVQFIRGFAKRVFDLLGSTLLILLLSPVLFFTALAILIESGRPVLFKQKRSATKQGKTFDFYKFRSMIQNAEEQKEQLFSQNESNGALFKLKNDPRVTEVGKFIRRYSIDELPQLFNVLKGDMSLVGPRPLPATDFEKVQETLEFWVALQERARVQPGITGLWQISGRSNLGFNEMVLLDCYYVENQSLLFDLEILFATIPVVLFGKGAY